MGVGCLFGPKGRRERRERKVGIALLGVGEAMVGAEVEVEGAGEEVEDIEEVEGRRGEGIRDTDGKVLPLGGWECCGVEEIMLVGLGVESQSRVFDVFNGCKGSRCLVCSPVQCQPVYNHLRLIYIYSGRLVVEDGDEEGLKKRKEI